jgi:hypothetical protein
MTWRCKKKRETSLPGPRTTHLNSRSGKRWPLVYSTTTSRTILLIRKVRVPTGTLRESDAPRITPDLIWSVVFIRDFEDGRLSWCRRRRRRRVRSADLTKGDGPWDVLVASCPPSMSAIRCEAGRRSQAGPCSTILRARLRPSRSAHSRTRLTFFGRVWDDLRTSTLWISGLTSKCPIW